MELSSNVKKLLAGKTVLITGTTGFVGKALLEKLLRDVPEVSRIVLFIRGNKRYPSAEERFWGEIYSSPVFDRQKMQDESAFKALCQQKIQNVQGEITERGFALDQEHYKRLSDRVDVIINSAASVNFREPIDAALEINTLSLMHLVEFVAAAGNIPVVHISTCYVNGYNRGEMLETPVRPSGKSMPKDERGQVHVEAVVDYLQTKVAKLKSKYSAGDELDNKLIDMGIKAANDYGWNDTYTFTKWMGEQLLIKHLAGKSLTILRPSIVESALQEPTAGWIEGVKVADALILAYARRRFSFFPARKRGVVDIIPVDMVVNGILLATAEAVLNDGQARIYQCCSSGQNPLRIADYIKIVTRELRDNWNHYPILTKGRPPKKKLKAVRRGAFLAAMKSLKSLIKAKSKMNASNQSMQNQAKSIDVTLKLSTIYSFYTNPHYVFGNNSLMQLSERMGDVDRQLFPVDCRAINWQDYLGRIHLSGLEKYGLTK